MLSRRILKAESKLLFQMGQGSASDYRCVWSAVSAKPIIEKVHRNLDRITVDIEKTDSTDCSLR